MESKKGVDFSLKRSCCTGTSNRTSVLPFFEKAQDFQKSYANNLVFDNA